MDALSDRAHLVHVGARDPKAQAHLRLRKHRRDDRDLDPKGLPVWNSSMSSFRFFDAERWFSQPVKHLSSGQLQLMFLIQYFLGQKELLLLDEPFQFLDPVQKDRVNAYLQDHLDSGVTLVLISHYENDIRRWTSQRMNLA